ncbi:hypothetical protein FKP32DRAFT_1588511 [Trametes sanguinea]|nr:hypothetical protein FKP32DRAFT_1588511 [Trametes sanguinea]
MLSTRPIALNADVDVDIASQPVLHAKTPGRKLKNRAALQENAIVHSGAKTVMSKKNILQTPFRPGTAHGKKQLVSVSVTRPLMDKTPFPNRVAPATGFGASKTPGAKGFKLSKLALLVPEPEQPELLSSDAAPLLRPSSTRKSLRGRLSGTFKTPVTKGDHWNVSPGDMELDIVGGPAEQATEQVVALKDEDDEIEYMPPTAIEPPYEPPFELPNYKSMGDTLFNLGHVPLQDDTLDEFYARDIDQQLDVHALVVESGPQSADTLELPELEDDSPFAKKAAKPGPSTGSSKPSHPATRIPSSRAASVSAARTQVTQKSTTTTPPSRVTARAASSSSSAPKPGPAPTRTSVLRAAKAAAASNSVTTPQPARPTASVTARPASAVPLRRAVSTTATTKPAAARPAASTAKPTAAAAASGPGTRGRSGTATSATLGRARSATVSAPSARVGSSSRVAVPAKPVLAIDDPLADIVEKENGLDDDFLFAV